MLPPYYDINDTQIELAAVFDETNYNPFLTEEQKRDLHYTIRGVQKAYENYAWEHYSMQKAWNTTPWYRNYMKFGYKDEWEYQARMHRLVQWMEYNEAEYMICKRKLLLHQMALDDLHANSKELNKKYAEQLTSKAQLHQGELFTGG